MVTFAAMRRLHDRRAGFTVIEMVLVLAVLGVLLSVGGLSMRTPAARTAANATQSFVQQARFEAVKTNRPVVVRVLQDGRGMSASRTSAANVVACASSVDAFRTLDVKEYRGVTLVGSGAAFVWLPTGQPRACPSGSSPLGVDGFTVAVRGSDVSATVHVAAGGEVTVK